MKISPEGARELHTYGGALMMAAGASWAYPPAGVVLLGLFLTSLGLFWRGR